jgi:hypothetical protein
MAQPAMHNRLVGLMEESALVSAPSPPSAGPFHMSCSNLPPAPLFVPMPSRPPESGDGKKVCAERSPSTAAVLLR